MTELEDFELKIMSSNKEEEGEAKTILMASKDLKNILWDKYQALLTLFSDKKTKTEIFKGMKKIEKIVYPSALNTMWTGIDFSSVRAEIPRLSDDFFDYPFLQDIWRLDLSNKKTTEISDKISQLKNLKEVFFNHNDSLPKHLFSIKSLETLVSRFNNIQTIPDEIQNLTSLQGLNIADNPIEVFPKVISNLTNLTWLNIKNTNITEIPEEIGKLTKLEQPNFENCRIKKLPESFWQLREFRYMLFSFSNLEEIPDNLPDYPRLDKFDIRGTNIPQDRIEKLIDQFGDKVSY
ncbi:leucine-rich repeat domain-containing protein [Spirochaeta cellobiosiphila]|uniref:leucine-rich repeat domain-containing protein n=1 Tax=Spirochaeta cellobiosiphila TaxID=504483 RepID=UPI0003F56875|nr:leucine-rich repeat domain-containing protein [Spirochaeta cellobiosiphila]